VHVVDRDALDLLRRVGQRDLAESFACRQQGCSHARTQEIAALQDDLPQVIVRNDANRATAWIAF